MERVNRIKQKTIETRRYWIECFDLVIILGKDSGVFFQTNWQLRQIQFSNNYLLSIVNWHLFSFPDQKLDLAFRLANVIGRTSSSKARVSVTRVSDLLHFGQLFKVYGNNYFAQIAHIFRAIFWRGQNLLFFLWNYTWETFIGTWRFFSGHSALESRWMSRVEVCARALVRILKYNYYRDKPFASLSSSFFLHRCRRRRWLDAGLLQE